jgi:hypothetical protein
MLFRRARGGLVWSSAVGIGAIVAAVGWPYPATALSSRTSAAKLLPLVAAGSVDVNGLPVADAQVTVFAEPTDEELDRHADGKSIMPLAQLVTGQNGKFEVRKSLDLPVGYRSSTETVNVLVLVERGDQSITWRFSVTADESPSDAPGSYVATTEATPASGLTKSGFLVPLSTYDLGLSTVKDGADGQFFGADSTGSARGKARSAKAITVARGGRENSLRRFAARFLAAGASRQRAILAPTTSPMVKPGHKRSMSALLSDPVDPVDPVDPTDPVDPLICHNEWTNKWKRNVSTNFMNVYAASGMSASLSQGTGGSSAFSLGIVLAKADGTLSTGGTVSKTWDTDVEQDGIVDAHVFNGTNYREQTVGCTSSRTWRPYSLYDMFTDFTYAKHVNNANCARKIAPVKWSTQQSRSMTITDGVSFPGWEVSAQSGFSTSQKITYNFTRNGYICGNSSEGPLQSSRLDSRPSE